MTKKAAVVGYPIKQSLSPIIHGHWLKKYGIDGQYEKLEIPPERFAQKIRELRNAGYSGVNVTVPHKEAAFRLADTADLSAKTAKAANLLIFGPSGIEARNTDTVGVTASIEASKFGSVKGKIVTVIGTGGAARANIVAASSMGAGEIRIAYRTQEKAMKIKTDLQGIGGNLKIVSLDNWKDAVAGTAILINATSAGMKENPPLDVSMDAVPQDALVFDNVYDPLKTKFLADAEKTNHKTLDGLEMLMHQAAPSFEAFFGVKPQVTKELRALLESKLHG